MQFNPLTVVAAGALFFGIISFAVARRTNNAGLFVRGVQVIPAWRIRSSPQAESALGKIPELVDVAVGVPVRDKKAVNGVAWRDVLPLGASVVDVSSHEDSTPRLPSDDDDDHEVKDLAITVIILMPSPHPPSKSIPPLSPSLPPSLGQDGKESTSITSHESELHSDDTPLPLFSLGTAQMPWHHRIPDSQ